jgi:Domain of unknown function (DUF1741)
MKSHTIAILLRLLTYLSSNKTRLPYHWSELWRTLLSLIRFLTTYASDLSSNPQINVLSASLVDLIAFSLSAGDTFLPDPESYDDLFYKIVETEIVITKFRDVYKLSLKPGAAESAKIGKETENLAAIDTLISVSTHFHSLLFQSTRKSSEANGSSSNHTDPSTMSTMDSSTHLRKNLSSRQVHQIIQQGYDTLSIQTHGNLNTWEKWREADWKLELKRVARGAVEDARKLALYLS